MHGILFTAAYAHLAKVIEVSRVHLFDIITQYRAIFTDDEPMLRQTSGNSPRESQLLQSWVQRKVTLISHTDK